MLLVIPHTKQDSCWGILSLREMLINPSNQVLTVLQLCLQSFLVSIFDELLSMSRVELMDGLVYIDCKDLQRIL